MGIVLSHLKPDEPEPNVGRAMPDMVGAAHPTVMALSLGKFYWFSSSIVIIIALDIVFPKIIPNLYLDDMQRLAAPILQTVPGADRDIGTLIFQYGDHFITIGDCCRAGYNHPVFGALAVTLQAEPRTGRDFDALDLEAVLILFQHGVVAPRTIDLGMIDMLGSAPLLQDINHFAHALGLIAL